MASVLKSPMLEAACTPPMGRAYPAPLLAPAPLVKPPSPLAQHLQAPPGPGADPYEHMAFSLACLAVQFNDLLLKAQARLITDWNELRSRELQLQEEVQEVPAAQSQLPMKLSRKQRRAAGQATRDELAGPLGAWQPAAACQPVALAHQTEELLASAQQAARQPLEARLLGAEAEKHLGGPRAPTAHPEAGMRVVDAPPGLAGLAQQHSPVAAAACAPRSPALAAACAGRPSAQVSPTLAAACAGGPPAHASPIPAAACASGPPAGASPALAAAWASGPPAGASPVPSAAEAEARGRPAATAAALLKLLESAVEDGDPEGEQRVPTPEARSHGGGAAAAAAWSAEGAAPPLDVAPTPDAAGQAQESERPRTDSAQPASCDPCSADAGRAEAAEGAAASPAPAAVRDPGPAAAAEEGARAACPKEAQRPARGGQSEPAKAGPAAEEGAAQKPSAPAGAKGHSECTKSVDRLREYLEGTWKGEKGEVYEVCFTGGTVWQCKRSDRQGDKRYTIRWEAQHGHVRWGHSYCLCPERLREKPGEAVWRSIEGQQPKPAFTWWRTSAPPSPSSAEATGLQPAPGSARESGGHGAGARAAGGASRGGQTWVPKVQPAGKRADA